MQKKTAACLAGICVTISLLLCSCSAEQYTVSFDAKSTGTAYEQQTVSSGKTAAAPGEPQKDGYAFLGWFQDAGLTEPWDISADKVKGNMTLYAGWDKDTGDAISEGAAARIFPASGRPGARRRRMSTPPSSSRRWTA